MVGHDNIYLDEEVIDICPCIWYLSLSSRTFQFHRYPINLFIVKQIWHFPRIEYTIHILQKRLL